MGKRDRFREYLRKAPRLSKKLTADTEKHIDECRRYLAEEERKTAMPPQVVVVTSAPVAQPVATPTPPAPTPQSAATSPTPAVTAPARTAQDSGAGMRTMGIVVGGVGVATLATAVLLNLKANQLASAVNDSDDSSKRSSQPSYRTASLVCYGMGGAALLTGGVLYWLGYRNGKSNAVAVLPTWSQGGAGLAVRGEY